jgi:quercetin dioxygenase-like cupin family protein
MRSLLATTVSVVLLAVVAYAASAPAPQVRLTADEIDTIPAHASGAGTSGVGGIRTTILTGDPAKAGPYTIRLSIPANTKIPAHTHRDDRTAIVISGVWYFGYGRLADKTAEKALTVGSFYSEPAGVAHFAETGADPVVVYITGVGPSDTIYIETRDDSPRG